MTAIFLASVLTVGGIFPGDPPEELVLLGDLDVDQDVDFDDIPLVTLAMLMPTYFQASYGWNPEPWVDFDQDEDVDFDDLKGFVEILGGQTDGMRCIGLGSFCGEVHATAIPEPSTAMLVLIGLFCLLGKRGRNAM